MTTLDVGIAKLRSSLTVVRSGLTLLRPSLAVLRTAAGHFYEFHERASATLKGVMPKGLYARALLIIIVPMVVLQSVVAFMFMERHYNLVTQRLSAGVVSDIATLIEVYKGYPQDADHAQLRRIAQEKIGLVVDSYGRAYVGCRNIGGGRLGRYVPITPNAKYDGRFTFVRLRYGPETPFAGQQIPWSHDYPLGEQHFMRILNELTYLGAHVEETDILPQHGGAPRIDRGEPIVLLGDQRARDRDILACLGEPVIPRGEACLGPADTGLERIACALAGVDRIAIKLHPALDLAQQRDRVVGKVGAIGEIRRLVTLTVGHLQKVSEAGAVGNERG